MRYSLVRATHDGTNPVLYAKREDGTRCKFVVKDFHPYFYSVQDVGKGDYQAIDGKIVHKLICDGPAQVPAVRENYAPHYEADIPFSRRFLIDRGLYSGFTCEKEGSVNFDDIVPTDFSISPKVLYLDIEVFSSGRMPDPVKDKITCIGVNSDGNLVSLLLDDTVGISQVNDSWTVLRTNSEEKLIAGLKSLLNSLQPDIIAGWNISFDLDYLRDRAKQLSTRLSMEEFCSFDLLTAYKATYRKMSNRLKDIALVEGITNEHEAPVDYANLWTTDKEALLNRNANHVKWCAEIDKKKGLINFYEALKKLAGLESYQDIFYASTLVDTLMLRKFNGKYVLPSRSHYKTEPYEGALVMEPPAGVFKDIAVYDISRYYPSIMLEHKLAPYGKQEALEIISDYFKFRDIIEEQIKLTQPGTSEYTNLVQKKMSVKAIVNALYGYFAFSGSRLFDQNIASSVTKCGREGIMKLRELAQSLGKEVKYADTDSIFVQISLDEASKFADKLNESFPYHLKLEKFFSSLMFDGSKKRYCGKIVYENGKQCSPFLSVTGFETVRGDASNLTKQIQEQVMKMVLDGKRNEIIDYLKGKAEEVKAGKYSIDDIAISKTLSRGLKGYDGTIPDYVRGARYAAEHLGEDIRAGDTVKMIYCKSPTDVICFMDKENLPKGLVVDWDKMIDRDIRMKVQVFLDVVDLHWEETLGQGRLL